MASGKVHAGIAVLNVALSVPVALHVAPDAGQAAGWGIVAGAVCGWLMTPDLDLPTRTAEERRIERRFGILGRLWLAYWSPYGWLFSHRGISHWPALGTATRAGYAFWWLGPAGLLAGIDPGFLWAAFWAWCVQDIYHLAADSFGVRLRV